jgi:hypothetical protein
LKNTDNIHHRLPAASRIGIRPTKASSSSIGAKLPLPVICNYYFAGETIGMFNYRLNN